MNRGYRLRGHRIPFEVEQVPCQVPLKERNKTNSYIIAFPLQLIYGSLHRQPRK